MRVPFVTRLAFIAWAVAEVAVFVLLVRWLGGWPVFWLLLATGFLGAWLIQKEGVRAWTSISAAVRSGQVPDRDMSSSRAVITSGLLLAMPGFVTDAIGLLLLVPVTRGLVRRLWVLLLPPLPGFSGGARRGEAVGSPAGPGVPPGGPVIEGEIVEPDGPPNSADDGNANDQSHQGGGQ